MNDIGQRLLNETNLLIDDKPHFFKQLVKNPEEYLTWSDVESCLNNPYLYQFEMIDQYNTKIDIPQHKKAWIWDREIQDKRFLFDKFHQGHGLVIMNYGFHSQRTMELLKVFETLYQVNSAIHVYCGLQNSKSFTIHDDYPCNFIIQVEGRTRWKIFNNRISYMYRTGTMNGRLREEDLEVAIDVTLEPGDGLYIPSRMYHCAYPEGKRLSMSIPCWNRFPNDPPTNAVDRNFYRIDLDV
jgi:ribosomal protein L16 Arg81 hydroxylase